MRYISKGPEPDELRAWKARANPAWEPSWDSFQNPEKAAVGDALRAEQGHLCCYCCGRINALTSHIEHLRPRSTYPKGSAAYEANALDYGNMLASCPGETEDPHPPSQHCGHAKGDWRVAARLQPTSLSARGPSEAAE